MASIYRRPDSPYWWMKWKDAAGKRHAKATRFRLDDPGQAKEARRTLELLERQLAAERSAGASVLTVRAFADTWLVGLKSRGVHSVEQFRARFRDYVLPEVGGLPLRDVRPHHVSELVLALGARELVRKPGQKLAPRTLRSIYAMLHSMFCSALRKELVTGNPCALEKHELPSNVDKDPTWRARAIFSRSEAERLLWDERIRFDRRPFYAALLLTGARIGEAMAWRWLDYDAAREPLGCLPVATSYSTIRKAISGTKTKTPRDAPVHPLLAQVLAEWRLSGWSALVGRPPRDEDLIFPAADEGHRDARKALQAFERDLKRLGMRHRRIHDLRRTFISLAQADGAPPHLLKWVTHGSRTSVMDQYTTPPWAELCAAVAKLRIRRLGAREVAALPRAVGAEGVLSELRSATPSEHSSEIGDLAAGCSTSSPSRTVVSGTETARSPRGTTAGGLQERPEQPADRSPPATTPDARILFLQSREWDRRRDRGSLSAYAEDRCCFCYRPVKPDAPRLQLTRDEGGEWFVVVPPSREHLPDEGTFGHFQLPIGPDCLKRHPEFRPGLVEPLPRSEGTQRTGIGGTPPGAPAAIGPSAPADPPREPRVTLPPRTGHERDVVDAVVVAGATRGLQEARSSSCGAGLSGGCAGGAREAPAEGPAHDGAERAGRGASGVLGQPDARAPLTEPDPTGVLALAKRMGLDVLPEEGE